MTLIMPWRIELFGRLRARRGDQNVERFRRGKEAALLAYLAFYSKQSHSREHLIDLFWPESSSDAGRLNLRVALHSLRRRLEPPGTLHGSILTADRATVQLNPGMIVTDVSVFEEALLIAHADRSVENAYLQKAIAVYSGELLPGYDDEWIGPERERLGLRFVEALRELAQALGKAGETTSALDFALRAVAADPLHEKAHLVLMRLYGQAGRATEALLQYNRLRRLLRQELTTVPSAEARRLARDLKLRPESFLIVTPQPAPSASSLTPDLQLVPKQLLPKREARMRSGLPLPSTRFFGREHEIASILALLHRPIDELGGRLITLTGSGGVGKTRLALEAACRQGDEDENAGRRSIDDRSNGNRGIPFPGDSIWLVSLAEVPAGALLADAIRMTLCQKATEGRNPLDQIIQELSDRPALLILDNFERLVEEGVSAVQCLLENLPRLWCLVTSRRPLGLSMEQVIDVLPLPVPQGHAPPAQLLAWPSVRLFVDRVQAKAPEFQVTAANAPAVFELVRGLEGIPLALELAAAWGRVYTPAHMVQKLADRYGWLTKNLRGVPDRHNTLRAAMTWSHDLLTLEEQVFLARLSVFRGSWSLAAARAISQEPQAALFLKNLQEHSWIISSKIDIPEEKVSFGETNSQATRSKYDDVSKSGNSEMRFQMLETLREFAHERLIARGLDAETHTSHFHYFLERAERAEAELGGQECAAWLVLMAADVDNFRAALDWCNSVALSTTQEGEKSEDEGTENDRGLQLGAALAEFWLRTGRFIEGHRWLLVLLEREKSPTILRSKALTAAGNLIRSQGDYIAAGELFKQARDIGQRLGDLPILAASLNNLGLVAQHLGNRVDARFFYVESLEIDRQRGNKVGVAKSYHNLGNLAFSGCEYSQAQQDWNEALACYGQLGDEFGRAGVLNNLGLLLRDQGQFAEARQCHQDALGIAYTLGNNEQLIAFTLNNLGVIADYEGNLDQARALFEESLVLKRKLNLLKSVSITLSNLGNVARQQGNRADARRFLQESLDIKWKGQNAQGIAGDMELFALLAQEDGKNERALHLLGCAEQLRSRSGFARTAFENGYLESALKTVEAALGSTLSAQLQAEGKEMPVESAVQACLDLS